MNLQRGKDMMLERLSRKRGYNISQVRQFIEENYILNWKQFKVLEQGRERCVLNKDIEGDCLSVVAVVYKGDKRLLRLLVVTNDSFKMHGENNKGKPELWQEFIVNTKTL